MINYLVEHNRYLSLVGIGVVLLIAWVFSRDRKAINYRLIANALLMQMGLGFVLLRLAGGASSEGGGLHFFANLVGSLYGFAGEGVRFVFGNLTDPTGSWGFIFAIKVLPIIIFFGALMSLLFYFGIVQRFVNLIGFVVRPLLGTSGAETLCAVANSFLGQTEAPLLIRHYLINMTNSEIFVVMVSGMATVSGAIMAVYAAMGVPAQHILVSALMAIPGSILIAKILYPETEESKVNDDIHSEQVSESKNVFDAIAAGTFDGLSLAMNVGAMLIVFISLIAMINSILGYISSGLSLDLIFGYMFKPFAYLLGLTGDDAFKAAELLGTKVTVNEMVAFDKMIKMGMSERAQSILTYALCGFSNFSCIGIQVGGIGALVPEKRLLITQLGLYAVMASSLANLMSALIAALFI